MTDIEQRERVRALREALEAVYQHYIRFGNPRPDRRGATCDDQARAWFRYNLLKGWVEVREWYSPEELQGVTDESDVSLRAARFVDLYARRVSANPRDLEEFAAYGWEPIRQYGEHAPPPPPPPPGKPAHYAMVGGKGVTVLAGTWSLRQGDPPPLGGEPGGLPKWEPDVRRFSLEGPTPLVATGEAGQSAQKPGAVSQSTDSGRPPNPPKPADRRAAPTKGVRKNANSVHERLVLLINDQPEAVDWSVTLLAFAIKAGRSSVSECKYYQDTIKVLQAELRLRRMDQSEKRSAPKRRRVR